MNPRSFRAVLVALLPLTALQPAALWAQDKAGGSGNRNIHSAVASAAAQQQSYEQATRDFRAHRHAAAYGRFARLADAGHVPSACIALLMARDGRALFANDWYASPDQLRRWSALTVQAAQQAPLPPGGDA